VDASKLLQIFWQQSQNFFAMSGSSPGSSAPSPTKSIGGSFASRQRRGSVQLEAVITRDRGSIELGG